LETLNRMNKNSRAQNTLSWLASQGKNLISQHVPSADTIVSKITDHLNIEVVDEQGVDPVTGATSNHKIISQKFSDDTELKIEITDTTPTNVVHRDMASRILEDKVGLMEDFMSGFFSFDAFESISDRISREDLDSIIGAVLSKNGISTAFQFGVFDMYDQSVYEEGSSYKNDLLESQFKISLFPNDFFGSPVYLSLHFPHEKRYIIQSMWVMLLVSAIFVIVIIYAFYYSISTIFKQKKLSIIKNDFINNMTHELKTPISTISLACEALTDGDIGNSEQTRHRFVNMINDENKRLGVLV